MSQLRGFVTLVRGGVLDRSSYNVATTCCVPVSWVGIVRHYPSTSNYVES